MASGYWSRLIKTRPVIQTITPMSSRKGRVWGRVGSSGGAQSTAQAKTMSMAPKTCSRMHRFVNRGERTRSRSWCTLSSLTVINLAGDPRQLRPHKEGIGPSGQQEQKRTGHKNG